METLMQHRGNNMTKTIKRALEPRAKRRWVFYMQEGDVETQKAQLEKVLTKRGGLHLKDFIEPATRNIHSMPMLQACIQCAMDKNAYILSSNMGKRLRNLKAIEMLVHAQRHKVRFYHFDNRDNKAYLINMKTLEQQSKAYRVALSETVKDKMARMKKNGYTTKKGEIKHSFGTPDPVAAGKRAGKSHQANYQHFVESLIPEIKQLQKAGITTLAGIAKELNQRGIQTRYNRSWHASSVRNLLIKMKGIK